MNKDTNYTERVMNSFHKKQEARHCKNAPEKLLQSIVKTEGSASEEEAPEPSFKLVEITPDGNGLPDPEKELAISSNIIALQQYCTVTLKKRFGKPETFDWKSYCIINESKTVIIDTCFAFCYKTSSQNQNTRACFYICKFSCEHFG